MLVGSSGRSDNHVLNDVFDMTLVVVAEHAPRHAVHGVLVLLVERADVRADAVGISLRGRLMLRFHVYPPPAGPRMSVAAYEVAETDPPHVSESPRPGGW